MLANTGEHCVLHNSTTTTHMTPLPRHCDGSPMLWPLTPKIDRVTWLFLKFDMQHGAYRHATGLKNIVTCDRPIS